MPSNYKSSRSLAARKRVAAQLPAPCYRCGRIVTAEMKWEADHPLSRVQAEALGISEAEQDSTVVPAHASCNHKHGAMIGNQLRAKTAIRRVTPIRREVRFSDGEPTTPAAARQNFYPEAAE